MFTTHRGAWWLALVGAAVVVACGGKKPKASPDVEPAATPPRTVERARPSAETRADDPPVSPDSSASPAPSARMSRDPAPQEHDPALYVVAHLDVSNSPKQLERRVSLARKLGFVGARIQFAWARLEPEAGVFDWAHQDSIVAAAEAAGLHMYGLLVYSPPWARPAGIGGRNRPMVDGSAERGNEAFAHFAAVAARRYRGRLDGWEIWNEPNIPNFWAHMENGRDLGPDPADYVSLYEVARDSILAAVPDVTVLTAGLATGPRRAPRPRSKKSAKEGYPAADFLNAMLQDGLRPAVVGLHPYTDDPFETGPAGRPVNPIVESAEKVLQEHDLPSTRLWITEWGLNARHLRDAQQAHRRYNRGLHALVCDPRIARVTVYALVDTGPQGRYGLTAADGEPTANGTAFSEVVSNWKACP